MATLMTTLLWIVFTLSAVFLGLIILIQEGKGGGLAEAFGGLGQETFGVGTRGVNKVTSILAGVFLTSAIFINKCAFQVENIGLPEAPPPADAPVTPGVGANPNPTTPVVPPAPKGQDTPAEGK